MIIVSLMKEKQYHSLCNVDWLKQKYWCSRNFYKHDKPFFLLLRIQPEVPHVPFTCLNIIFTVKCHYFNLLKEANRLY